LGQNVSLAEDFNKAKSPSRWSFDTRYRNCKSNVPYDEWPDFEDSNDFELLATVLSYQPPQTPVEDAVKTILWRTGIDAASEAAHATDVAELLLAIEPSEIVTFNGERFDFRHLLGRGKIAGEKLDDMTAFSLMGDALGSVERTDLKPSAWETYGRRTSLEELIEKEGLNVRRTLFESYNHGHSLAYRPPDKPPHVEGGDIPELGEPLLQTFTGEETEINVEAMESMIEDYALGDIENLLLLADQHPF
jgi:hypothetical protein